MKVVINKCYGGFGLSREGMVRYAELKGIPLYPEEDKYGNFTYWKTPKETRLDLILDESRSWADMPIEKRQEFNRRYSEQTLYDREIKRDDPFVQNTHISWYKLSTNNPVLISSVATLSSSLISVSDQIYFTAFPGVIRADGSKGVS